MAVSPIDTYLEMLEHPAARRTLSALRDQLRKLLPDATETISYRMPAYRLANGKVAAGFAFSGKNCGYYPHSGNIVPQLQSILSEYRTTPGAVSFPPERPLPAGVVKALVRARLEEIASPKKRAPKRTASAARTRSRSTRRATSK